MTTSLLHTCTKLTVSVLRIKFLTQPACYNVYSVAHVYETFTTYDVGRMTMKPACQTGVLGHASIVCRLVTVINRL